MPPSMKSRGRSRFCAALADRFETEPGDPAPEVFDQFLSARVYSREMAEKLFALARDRSTSSWNVKRVAVLMLEKLFLLIPEDAVEEQRLFLTNLGFGSRELDEQLSPPFTEQPAAEEAH